jgi:hypothetical protein
VATSLFNLTIKSSASVGTDLWIDLGLIPSGYDYRIGSWTVTAIGKAMTFELRTNMLTKSVGTLATTTTLALVSARADRSVTGDLYKRGTLQTKTVVSTGVEHWWIRVTSKSGTTQTMMYQVSYLRE